jgi:hypothetical protein
VCRCEGAAAKDVTAAIADGDPTLRGVKNRTRAGMGRCQGRFCGYLVSRMIAKRTGATVDQVKPGVPRPPVKPVPLGVLAASADESPCVGNTISPSFRSERRSPTPSPTSPG